MDALGIELSVTDTFDIARNFGNGRDISRYTDYKAIFSSAVAVQYVWG